jgi:NAD(P)-dependent dehydrogenase (short-subunit alcohol dehydrogenase family)
LGRFRDSVAVVTGAGSGIGRAVVRLLLAEGAAVAAVDWNREAAAEAVAASGSSADRSLVFQADVTDASQVEAMYAAVTRRFGRIDVLVTAAGIVEGDDVLNIEPKLWDQNIESVLKSVYLCCRSVLPVMLRQSSGAIVNLASVNGIAAFGDDAYSAAKAGVISLTKSIAVRYGERGVRCNAVAPADVRTPRWDARVQDDPAIFERLRRWYPLQRVGEAEDVAHAVLFLASGEASWITGIVLVVDGGLLAGSAALMRDTYPLTTAE